MILAAADLRGYTGDEDALLDLIDDATAPPDPKVAHLAMPEPKKARRPVHRAAGAPPRSPTCGASAGPPVDRFAPNGAEKPRRRSREGFFTKLFASLIE